MTDFRIDDISIMTAFENTEFGRDVQSPQQKRDYLATAIVDAGCGLGTGGTIRAIMRQLGMTKKNGMPTKRALRWARMREAVKRRGGSPQ